MKLILSSPKTPLRSRAFSARTAWWVLVAIAATLAVFRLLRNTLEAGLQ